MGSVVGFVRLGPSFLLFIMLNVVGVIMVVFSGGLFGAYVGFECSFVGMMGILSGVSAEENEGCMKYFVFQALGSVFLLLGFIGVICSKPVDMGIMFSIIGLCLKAGFFPFFYWVPSVLSYCSWFGCFMVVVWQKIAPMCFLAKWGVSYGFIDLMSGIACLTAFVGGVGGIGSTYYRSLLGYSSLVHSGWMILSSLVGLSVVVFYLVVYSIISGGLMYRMYSCKVMCLEDFCNMSYYNYFGFYIIFIDFVSLAGLPGLPGFLPKCVTVFMIGGDHGLSLVFLLFSSALSLFYYLKVGAVGAIGSGVNHYLIFNSDRWSSMSGSGYLKWNVLFYMICLAVLIGFMVSC
uniref:NADH dehydrogenase subunit 2 n=1 Tax=Teredothyra matocotana TaxID=2795841 RepID=UPI0020278FF8|nr:NADH dehydrogenase subunit 2 [Teredothyra matocotana]UPX89342.1 NADH dehydrogenase subunit 2 [Teredothyra matocotana]